MPATSSAAFNKAMGAAIRKERLARGMTMADLGKQLGVSYQQIQKNEYGINGLSAFTVMRVAEIFELTLAQLYERAAINAAVKPAAEPSEAENAGYLAARYVQRIADPKLRSNVVDFARKLAYSGAPT
jgi:transcriptional regulator with XRE-family HTH domain